MDKILEITVIKKDKYNSLLEIGAKGFNSLSIKYTAEANEDIFQKKKKIYDNIDSNTLVYIQIFMGYNRPNFRQKATIKKDGDLHPESVLTVAFEKKQTLNGASKKIHKLHIYNIQIIPVKKILTNKEAHSQLYDKAYTEAQTDIYDSEEMRFINQNQDENSPKLVGVNKLLYSTETYCRDRGLDFILNVLEKSTLLSKKEWLKDFDLRKLLKKGNQNILCIGPGRGKFSLNVREKYKNNNITLVEKYCYKDNTKIIFGDFKITTLRKFQHYNHEQDYKSLLKKVKNEPEKYRPKVAVDLKFMKKFYSQADRVIFGDPSNAKDMESIKDNSISLMLDSHACAQYSTNQESECYFQMIIKKLKIGGICIIVTSPGILSLNYGTIKMMKIISARLETGQGKYFFEEVNRHPKEINTIFRSRTFSDLVIIKKVK